MAHIVAMSTAVPPYRTDAEETKAFLTAFMGRRASRHVAGIVDASRVRERHSVVPLPTLTSLRTLEERTQLYTRHAVTLGASVAWQALQASGVNGCELDAFITVSNTGYIVPSLDVHLANCLGLNPTCRRIAVAQLGCAGGVAAFGLATELLAIGRRRQALVVSVELPSLCLPTAEPSLADAIAITQFGDGAGAAVLSAGDHSCGPEILATQTVLFADTVDASEVRLTESGLRAVRGQELEGVLRRHLARAVDDFLHSQQLRRCHLSFWLAHPRTPQLLQALGEALELSDRALEPSWSVWETAGNLISASVFFMLRHVAQHRPPGEGDLGLMLALGVGVSCEMALLRWRAQAG